MGFKFDTINILVLIVTITNIIYGLIVYSRNRKDKTNLSFFILTLGVGFWGLSMFAYRWFIDESLVLIFSRILYLAAATIPISFLYFVFIFPNEDWKANLWQKIILPLPLILIAIISLWPNILIRGVNLFPNAESFIVFDQRFHLLYGVYIVSYFGAGYLWLIKKLFGSSGVFRQQIIYIIVGTLMSTSIGVTTNLILPYVGNFTLNWLGQIGVIAMIVAISYAILKHHLFNIRVIATEIFFFSFWTFTFIRTLLAGNESDKLTNFGSLALAIVIGLLLIRSARKLDEANRNQEGLIHLISHEVKSGLNKAINVFAEIVEGAYDSNQKLLKEDAGMALKDDRKVVEQIEDVLHSVNFKTGKVTYDMKLFDFKEALMESVGKYRPEAEAKGLKLDIQIKDGENYTVNGDRGLIIGHLFKNLFENSINFTSAGGIMINLSRADNKIRLSVKDTGVGITPEDKKVLFTEGGHGKDSQKINVHSTGFGLFITKQIVKAHHGKIWAESEGEGRGSTFFVEFPAS